MSEYPVPNTRYLEDSDRLAPTGRDCALFADLPAFPLGETAPDPELLAADDGELEALDANFAGRADRFGLARGSAAFRKEQIGVGASAAGVVLPREIIDRQRFNKCALHRTLTPV